MPADDDKKLRIVINNRESSKRRQVWKRLSEETTLYKWMKMKGKTREDVAKGTDSTLRTVEYWMHGQMLPGLVSAFKIEAYTKGAVPVASWLGTAIANAKWNNTWYGGIDARDGGK